MIYSNYTVAFKIKGINHGLQEAKGLLKLKEDEEGIILEFEVTDSFVGAMKSGVKEVEIAYSDLLSIQFKKGLFRPAIILKGNGMKTFEAVPGVEIDTCTLAVKWKNREQGQKVVSKAKLALSESKLRAME